MWTPAILFFSLGVRGFQTYHGRSVFSVSDVKTSRSKMSTYVFKGSDKIGSNIYLYSSRSSGSTSLKDWAKSSGIK